MPKTATNQPSAAKIAAIEAALLAKYGDKIVPGTVRRAPEGTKYGLKMLVDINTRGVDGEYDGNTRTVATSDVWQVHNQEKVKKELDKQNKAAKTPKTPAKPKAAKTSKAKPTTSKTKKAAEALGVA